MDDALNKLKKLEEAKKVSDKEIAKLKSDLKVTKDCLHTYQAALNDLEQYSRRECLELRDIPVVSRDISRENTEDIVNHVADCIGVELCSDDISICHRLPVNNMPAQMETRSSFKKRPMNPTIIVKFVRRKKREEFYRARNIIRGKTVNDLNLNLNTGERMFIAESLTRANKELFGKALQAKKDRHFKYIWTSQGKIFMRKEDSTNVIQISCEKDIESKIH